MFVCIYVCASHVCWCHGRPDEAWDPLQLELPIVVTVGWWEHLPCGLWVLWKNRKILTFEPLFQCNLGIPLPLALEVPQLLLLLLPLPCQGNIFQWKCNSFVSLGESRCKTVQLGSGERKSLWQTSLGRFIGREKSRSVGVSARVKSSGKLNRKQGLHMFSGGHIFPG